jgi:hypothetical protein
MRGFRFCITSVTLAAALLGSTTVHAADTPSKEDIKALMDLVKAQKKQLETQQQQLELHQKKLEAQQAQYEALQNKLSGLANPEQPKTTTSNVDSEQRTANSTTPAEVGTDRKQQNEEKPPEIAANLDEGGVLLKKGSLVITPALEYSRSSATLVSIEGFSIIPAINIGTFEVSNVARDVLTSSIGARLGVTNSFEIEGKIPYVYRKDATTGRPIGGGSVASTTTSLDRDGIGDVEVGAHYQINKGKGGWPFFIGNLRLKTVTGEGPFEIPTGTNGLLTDLPTGTGFYAWQPSVTAIFPSDPVVYYANLGYMYNVERDFGGTVGTVNPGDSVSGSFGMSMSLNDRASFSLGYSHSTVFETEQNGRSINNGLLQVGTFDLGYAYQLSNRYSLNFNVSAGVTEDAPDARVGVRVPIKFDLF